MRRELGLGARPVLLYHGALSPGRGIEATLAAMPLLPKEVAFVILGNGSLAPYSPTGGRTASSLIASSSIRLFLRGSSSTGSLTPISPWS